MSQLLVPDSIFSSRIPFQRDGKRNHIRYGDLTDFKSRGEDSALWNQETEPMRDGKKTLKGHNCYQMQSCWTASSQQKNHNVTHDWPGGHILWPRPHLRSASCWSPSRRTCWFFLWRPAFWKHRPLFLQHGCHLFSDLHRKRWQTGMWTNDFCDTHCYHWRTRVVTYELAPINCAREVPLGLKYQHTSLPSEPCHRSKTLDELRMISDKVL